MAIEKPKLEHARDLRGIYSIDPSDDEYKDIVKNARRKLETSEAAAMPCKRAFSQACIRETVVSKNEPKHQKQRPDLVVSLNGMSPDNADHMEKVLSIIRKTYDRKPTEDSVRTMLEPLFRTFLLVKAKTACIGKPLLERERERERRKRRFRDQCCRVDVKEKSMEQN